MPGARFPSKGNKRLGIPPTLQPPKLKHISFQGTKCRREQKKAPADVTRRGPTTEDNARVQADAPPP